MDFAVANADVLNHLSVPRNRSARTISLKECRQILLKFIFSYELAHISYLARSNLALGHRTIDGTTKLKFKVDVILSSVDLIA